MFGLPSNARRRAGQGGRLGAGRSVREPRERHRRPRASTCGPPGPHRGAPHASRRGLRLAGRQPRGPGPGGSPRTTAAPRVGKGRARASSALPEGTPSSPCPAGPGRRPRSPRAYLLSNSPAAPSERQDARSSRRESSMAGGGPGRAAVAEALPLPGGRGSGCRPGRPRCHSSGAAASSAPSLSLSFSRSLPARLAARRRRRGAGSGSAARPRQRRPRPARGRLPCQGHLASVGHLGRQRATTSPSCCRQRGTNRGLGALRRVGFLVMSFCISNFLKEDGYALLSAKLPSKGKKVMIWPSFTNKTFPTTELLLNIYKVYVVSSVSNTPINSSQV